MSTRLLSLVSLSACFVACAAGACSSSPIGPGPDAGPDLPDTGSPLPDGSSPTEPDGGPGDAAVPDAARPDATTADAGTCAVAPSPGRGVVEVLTPAALGFEVSSLGVVCDRMALSSEAKGAARWWEGGTLRTCKVGACASTAAVVPSFDVHTRTRFVREGNGLLAYGGTQPFSLASGPLDTPGDVIRISNDGSATRLGTILDPVAGAAATFGGLTFVGTSLVLDVRTYRNHGNGKGIVVIRDALGTPAVVDVVRGGEVDGYSVATTPTRLFALGEGYGSTSLVDVAAAKTTTFYGGAFRKGFLWGERLVGVGWDRASSAPNTQVACESDGACTSPSVIVNPALPNDGYLGIVKDAIVWHERTTPEATTGTIKACGLATWGTAACVPETIASDVPTPEGDAHTDGQSVYFASNGSAVRVGL